MALTKAQRAELDAYKVELREEFAASQANNANNVPAPQVSAVPELELPDVLRILVQHSRIPLESTALACLDAIDRAFAEPEPADDEDDAPADDREPVTP